MKKIYLASSWRNDFQPLLVNLLKENGHEIYDFRHPEKDNIGFSWAETGLRHFPLKEYILNFLNALEHPKSKQAFKHDFNAMKWADTFILCLPCGKSAHLELGWAVGKGKRTAILTEIFVEPELMYKMIDTIEYDTYSLLEWLKT